VRSLIKAFGINCRQKVVPESRANKASSKQREIISKKQLFFNQQKVIVPPTARSAEQLKVGGEMHKNDVREEVNELKRISRS